MDTASVVVENMGKQYRAGVKRGGYRTLREAVVDTVKAPWQHWRNLRGSDKAEGLFWALKDVSFTCRPGEAVGIIGRNGAGKTTLLKLLSRITRPTTGRAVLNGRVGSLLEIGTGFHPELTGLENIYLNGVILGMRRSEITDRLEQIIAFAGIEDFIHTPVKRFSSGMYIRLAFSVAAHLEPEILLVDEVLAVGDADFQQKCLGKMQTVAEGGRIVLHVSHNLASIRAMCNRCIWIDDGRIRADGPADQVISDYLHSLSAIREKGFSSPAIDAMRVQMRTWEGLASDRFPMGDPFEIVLDVEPDGDQGMTNLHLVLFDQLGQKVSTVCTPASGHGPFRLDGPTTFRARFDGGLLPGEYRWLMRLRHVSKGNLIEVENAFEFTITPKVLPNAPRAYPTGFGSVLLRPEIEQCPLEVSTHGESP